MHRFLMGCALVLMSSVASADGGSVLFVGQPMSKLVVVDGDSTPVRTVISAAEGKSLRLVIEKNGSDYIWVNRGERKLFRVGGSGVFKTWISPDGAGYVKVAPRQAFDPSAKPEDFVYVEHLTLALGSVTYWGVAFMPSSPAK